MSDLVAECLELAVSLAREAGAILMEHFDTGVAIDLKGEIDPVTELDRRVELFLVESIRGRFPGHDFLAEEQTRSRGGCEYRWVIDPLDGTTNYAHGYPCFTVSIALERQGRPVLGVVFQPATNEMFRATAGGGAWLGERRLAVSAEAQTLDRAYLVTGFPYNLRQPGVLERNLRRFEKILGASFAVRRDGSAAYDLACVAAGRFDAFWEENLNHWDTAAGELMVREAGGLVTDFSGGTFHGAASKTILASANEKLHEEIIAALGDNRH